MFLRKNHILRCWCELSFLNRIGVLISVAKRSSKKIRALIRSMNFIFPDDVQCETHLDESIDSGSFSVMG